MLVERRTPIRYRCRVAAYATLRASDADREAVADRLRRAAIEGRLEPDELEQRLDAALRARTYGELDRLLIDLPSGAAPRRDRGWIATSVRTAAAVAIPLAVALITVLVIAAVIVVAAAGWMLWMLIAVIVCHARRSSRRRHSGPMRSVHRTRPAGLL
jgi:Domain of unknown function (DUF1707)